MAIDVFKLADFREKRGGIFKLEESDLHVKVQLFTDNNEVSKVLCPVLPSAGVEKVDDFGTLEDLKSTDSVPNPSNNKTVTERRKITRQELMAKHGDLLLKTGNFGESAEEQPKDLKPFSKLNFRVNWLEFKARLQPEHFEDRTEWEIQVVMKERETPIYEHFGLAGYNGPMQDLRTIWNAMVDVKKKAGTQRVSGQAEGVSSKTELAAE
ncbi:hypothetical protein G7046_g2640 [Stylonectria norvegica]|nr:hypothetical protein G7046_g2640 [Stylonectria norvegica]